MTLWTEICLPSASMAEDNLNFTIQAILQSLFKQVQKDFGQNTVVSPGLCRAVDLPTLYIIRHSFLSQTIFGYYLCTRTSFRSNKSICFQGFHHLYLFSNDLSPHSKLCQLINWSDSEYHSEPVGAWGNFLLFSQKIQKISGNIVYMFFISRLLEVDVHVLWREIFLFALLFHSSYCTTNYMSPKPHEGHIITRFSWH
jgi:hypothetical protein